MISVHIIANPVAGGGRGAVMARALKDALEARDLAVTTFATLKAGDAREEAGRTEANIVAIIGGDGTLNEVLNGLPERSEARLAILPMGTANVVARQIGMRPDAAAVADAIVGGLVIPMDLGLHGSRRFLLGAGAGLDAAVTKAVHDGRGTKSSLIRWVLPALGTLSRYTYPKIRVTVDGETIATGADYAIIGNCRNSAGIFPATPRAHIADQQLDVCVLSGLTLARIIWLLANVWRPEFIDQPWITYRQGKSIALHPESESDPVYLQIDGDPAGTLPARFDIADWPIYMVVSEIGANGRGVPGA